MAELLQAIDDLRQVKGSTHWFCGRDDLRQDGGQEPPPSKIPEGIKKRVFSCIMVFSYDGPNTEDPKQFMKNGIGRNLLRCEHCIIAYYKGKRAMLESLRDEGYEDEQVDTFDEWLEDHGVERISRALQRAKTTLDELSEDDRQPSVLSRSSVMALHEALYCRKFMKNEELMTSLFDEPFRVSQLKTNISPKGLSPALAQFVFSDNDYRRNWAMYEWQIRPEIENKEEFDFALRPGLGDILRQVSPLPITDIPLVTKFWTAMKEIVTKLPPNLITHGLRTLDVDACRLTIDHLNTDTTTFIPLMQCMAVFLEKSPHDFWDAMGPISPQAIIEGIFHNSVYDRTISAAGSDEPGADADVQALTAWVKPFMISVQSSNQPPACRQLSTQFLRRLQADRFPIEARSRCYEVGLSVLKWTVLVRLQQGTVSDAVSRAVAIDLLAIVTNFLDEILARIEGKQVEGPVSEQIISLCQDTVRAALTLECRLLRIDHETLVKEKHLTEGSKHVSLGIWKKVVPRITTKATILARVALPATTELSDLGQFGPKGPEGFADERSRFNKQFKECMDLIARVFGVIGDIDPMELQEFVQDDAVRPALIAALLSSEEGLYEAAMDVAKNASGESIRQDALRHIIEPRLAYAMDDFSATLNRISASKNFYSCPRMLRTSNDILAILCDAQDGPLRRPDMSDDERAAIARYWSSQWRALKTVYDKTENWSAQQDKAMMKEFCRDAMQFSEKLFNEYVVFRSVAPEDQSPDGQEKSQQRLLVDPCQTMDSMVAWLRLRDDYLAAKAVNIIKSLMEKLYQNQMTISDAAITTLSRIVQDITRTNLTLQQKTEIRSALEGEDGVGPGVKLDPVPTSDSTASRNSVSLASRSRSNKFKTGKIDLASWAANARSGEGSPSNVVDLTDELVPSRAKEIRALSSSVKSSEKAQQQAKLQAAHAQQKAERQRKTEEAKQAEFLEKRQKEKLERRQADQARAAQMKASNVGVPGGSAALNAIGNHGKEHRKETSELFASSDSSSGESSDDDANDNVLFKNRSKSTVFDDTNRARQQQSSGPYKLVRNVRGDRKSRVIVSLNELHKDILKWDLFTRGDFPPGSARHDYTLVSDSFKNWAEYKSTFHQLLLLEAWQGMQQTVEEGLGKQFSVSVASRLSIDNFVQVVTTIDTAEFQSSGIGESDLVILANQRDSESAAARCLARVERIGRKRKNGTEITFNVTPDNNPLLGKFTGNTEVFGAKVTSLTPLEREYRALMGLNYYDLREHILKAEPCRMRSYSDEKLAKICRMYNLNAAQAKAVQTAVENDAFTLIQGPPGSGKTKTITSIVGALLTKTLQAGKAVAIPRPGAPNGSSTAKASDSSTKKILVCAPSNAAVDELVMRLMNGVKTYAGEEHKINVIRLGKSDKINPKVASVTLDELVSKEMGNSEKTEQGTSDIARAMSDHHEVNEEIKRLRTVMDQRDSEGQPRDHQLSTQFESLKSRRQALSKHIDTLKDNGNSQSREADVRRDKVRSKILESAHVLCATLSGSGHEMFRNVNIDFETVIIDEAAQSVELSALIPLKYGCTKCIMVGDPKQLPPTVLSREASRFQYEQSLFVRMQKNKPDDVHLLDTQYRMHPEISQFPSKTFYDGLLRDGPSMGEERTKFWHQDQYLGPYRFFDVKGQHQSGPRGHSLINTAEIDAAIQLYLRLGKVSVNYDFRGKIGIITPYKSQLQRLRDTFKRRFGEDITDAIEFNTTDAFQGRESEVIIFSCVRASEGGIGFLSDIRRMNVGITRAKCSLWVLGNIASLQKGEYWRKMITNARERHLVTQGDVSKMLQQGAKPLKNTQAPKVKPAAPASTNMSPISPTDEFKNMKGEYDDAMDIDEPASKAAKRDFSPTNGLSEKRKRDSFDPHQVRKEVKRESVKKEHIEPEDLNGGDLKEEGAKGEDVKQESAKRAPPKRPMKPPMPAKRGAASVFITNKKRK